MFRFIRDFISARNTMKDLHRRIETLQSLNRNLGELCAKRRQRISELETYAANLEEQSLTAERKNRERTRRAYRERNALVIAFARLADRFGLKAGYGVDEEKITWHDDWRTVIYVDLPNGLQVSWHLDPEAAASLPASGLPKYERQWDGSYIARNSTDWALFDFPRRVDFADEHRISAPTVASMLDALSRYPHNYRVLFDHSEDMWGLHEIGVKCLEGTTSDGPGSIMLLDHDDEHEAPSMSDPLPPEFSSTADADTNEA